MKVNELAEESVRLYREGRSVEEVVERVKSIMDKKMTLDNFMDMQQELDDKILVEKLGVEATIENHQKLINQRLLGLIVEAAELSNELRTFKYWSVKPSGPRERVLEEYVDSFFMWLSIGNTLEFTSKEIEEMYKKKYAENVRRIGEGY